MKRMVWILSLAVVLLTGGGRALALNVGSDGSDGALNLTGTGTTTIDLRNAVKTSWTTPGDGTGKGVYDSTMWAVVFKYSSVNIGTGRIVQFINNLTDAPVIWLVRDSVSIAGTVTLNGEATQVGGNFSKPGPGGFRGGRGLLSTSQGSAGMGPGGGGYAGGVYGGGGGYYDLGSGPLGGAKYGNARVLPLIGGSGGGGRGDSNAGGGAGGGAILVATNGPIRLTGGIQALGGAPTYSGGGSGGGIRLIANLITGSASGLLAYGGSGSGGYAGSAGRIRIEANTIGTPTNPFGGASNPQYSPMFPLENNEAVIWPIAGAPTVRVATFAGLPVPLDPQSEFNPPGDLLVVSTDSVDVGIEASNVPTVLSRRWNMKLRMVRRSGVEVQKLAQFAGGDSIASTWTVRVPPLPEADFVTIQARASKP